MTISWSTEFLWNAQIYGKPINRLNRWNLFQWFKVELWEDPPGCKHDHDVVLAWGAEQCVQVGRTLAHLRARSRSRELSQQASGKQSVRMHRLQRWGELGDMGGKFFLFCALGWWQNQHLPTQPSVSRITCLISLLSYQTNFPLLLYHYGKGYSALKNRKYSTVKGECAPRFKTFPQESQPLARALIELKKSFAFIASDCLWKFLRLALQEDCLLGCWLSLVQSYCWIWKSSIGNKCSLQTRYWNTHFVKVK